MPILDRSLKIKNEKRSLFRRRGFRKSASVKERTRGVCPSRGLHVETAWHEAARGRGGAGTQAHGPRWQPSARSVLGDEREQSWPGRNSARRPVSFSNLVSRRVEASPTSVHVSLPLCSVPPGGTAPRLRSITEADVAQDAETISTAFLSSRSFLTPGEDAPSTSKGGIRSRAATGRQLQPRLLPVAENTPEECQPGPPPVRCAV